MAKKTREQKKRAQAAKDKRRRNRNPFKVPLDIPGDADVYSVLEKHAAEGTWVAQMSFNAVNKTMEHFGHPKENWNKVGNVIIRLGILMAEQPEKSRFTIDANNAALNSIFDQYEYYLKMMGEEAMGSPTTRRIVNQYNHVQKEMAQGKLRADFTDEEIQSWQKVTGMRQVLQQEKYPDEDIDGMIVEILETAKMVMGDASQMSPIQYIEDFKPAKCQCGGVNCNHGIDGVFLNQRCHQSAGVLVEIKDRIMRLSCAVCWTPITNIAIVQDVVVFHDIDGKLLCRNHPPRVEVFYENGQLAVTCYECKELLDTFTIRSSSAS